MHVVELRSKGSLLGQGRAVSGTSIPQNTAMQIEELNARAAALHERVVGLAQQLERCDDTRSMFPSGVLRRTQPLGATRGLTLVRKATAPLSPDSPNI